MHPFWRQLEMFLKTPILLSASATTPMTHYTLREGVGDNVSIERLIHILTPFL